MASVYRGSADVNCVFDLCSHNSRGRSSWLTKHFWSFVTGNFTSLMLCYLSHVVLKTFTIKYWYPEPFYGYKCRQVTLNFILASFLAVWGDVFFPNKKNKLIKKKNKLQSFSHFKIFFSYFFWLCIWEDSVSHRR